MLVEDFLFSLKAIDDKSLSKALYEIKMEQKRRLSISRSLSDCAVYSDTPSAKFISENCSRHLQAPKQKKLKNRIKYWPPLLCQDWSCIYPRDSDFGEHYVYAHVDPRTWGHSLGKGFGPDLKGTPFYIGKGVAGRAYDLKRNQGHGRRISELKDYGFDDSDIVVIMFDGLSDGRALEIESKLIHFYGTIYEGKKAKGVLLNLDIPRTPEFSGMMSCNLGRV